MIVKFVDVNRAEFGVEPVCAALQAAPSTYWSAKRRPPSARALRDAKLMPLLLVLWQANYSVYGSRKLWVAARRAGHDIGRDQVARLMRQLGIRGVKRTKTVRTTRPDPKAARPPDLVERAFTAERPNRLWVTDLTHVATWSGVAYVCFITDAFSRRIVGWRVASHMRTQTVLDALEMARWSRGARLEGLITHADAGSQGGFNRWLQHLDVEVCDGQAVGVVGDADGETGDEVAGASADSSGCGAGVLGEDRRGAHKRGRGDRVRGVGSRRIALVPRTWGNANSRAGSVYGALPVLQ